MRQSTSLNVGRLSAGPRSSDDLLIVLLWLFTPRSTFFLLRLISFVFLSRQSLPFRSTPLPFDLLLRIFWLYPSSKLASALSSAYRAWFVLSFCRVLLLFFPLPIDSFASCIKPHFVAHPRRSYARSYAGCVPCCDVDHLFRKEPRRAAWQTALSPHTKTDAS